MRKALYAVSIAALAAALATPALAEPPRQPDYVAPAAGVVGGTVVGLGLTEAWWGASPAIQPCAGFHAMFLLNENYCAQQNAQQIAYEEGAAAPASRHGRHARHYYR
jgi:hypothetical protein